MCTHTQEPQFGAEEAEIEASAAPLADQDARYMALVRDRLRKASVAAVASAAAGGSASPTAAPAPASGRRWVAAAVQRADSVPTFTDPWNPKDSSP